MVMKLMSCFKIKHADPQTEPSPSVLTRLVTMLASTSCTPGAYWGNLKFIQLTQLMLPFE